MLFCKHVIDLQLSFNASIHPRGVWYNKSNEGAYYSDATDVHLDGSVPPNGTYIYEWLVPDEVAPTQQDTPCIAWLYASDTDPVKDTYSGTAKIQLLKNILSGCCEE